MPILNKINYSANSTGTIKTSPAVPLAIGTGILGIGGGALYGAIKKVHVINSDGQVKDSFTKTVYNKYLKKTSDESIKTFEKQRFNIIEKIKNVKKPDDLKKLINDNKELVDKILATSNQTAEDFASKITRFSMRKSKKNIIKGIENAYQLKLDDFSNKILECWNGTRKKFEKTSKIPNELYKSIRSSKISLQAKQAGKTACITGLVLGGATFVIAKVIDIIKNRNINKQPF